MRSEIEFGRRSEKEGQQMGLQGPTSGARWGHVEPKIEEDEAKRSMWLLDFVLVIAAAIVAAIAIAIGTITQTVVGRGWVADVALHVQLIAKLRVTLLVMITIVNALRKFQLVDQKDRLFLVATIISNWFI